VVNHKQTSLFLLIFSLLFTFGTQGVAGSNPAAPTILPKSFTLRPAGVKFEIVDETGAEKREQSADRALVSSALAKARLVGLV
jgi:hypothetical protein